jgi:hypothetical protein
MRDRLPFTIEILGFDASVLDRVIGGTVDLDEAKRIGRHLLSIVESENRPLGYRVLSHDLESVYTWHLGDGDETQPGPPDDKFARTGRHGLKVVRSRL